MISVMSFAALLQQLGHERRPSGLMAGANARSRVAVEVLVERNQVMPVRIDLKELDASEYGTESP